MSTKTLNNVRFQLRRDTAANWEAKNEVLLDGEKVIVITNAGQTRFKVGDGVKTFMQLPYTDEILNEAISKKVSKVDGKGLSTEDFTTELKTKLDNLNSPTKVSELENDAGYLTEHQDISGKLDTDGFGTNVKAVFTTSASRSSLLSGSKLGDLFGKISRWLTDLKAVAFSGSYNDLSDTPTIPATAADIGARPDTWTPTATDVGADTAGTASSAVSTHNASATAHSSLFSAKADKSTKVSATIGTTWTGSAAPYTQTISVTGATATNAIEVKLPSSATQEQIEAYQKLNPTDGGQAAGSITIKAWGTKNTISIPVEIIVRGDL